MGWRLHFTLAGCRRLPNQAPSVRDFWTVEFDSTVMPNTNGEASEADAAVSDGGEAVARPLSDRPETWDQFSAVLEVLRPCMVWKWSILWV